MNRNLFYWLLALFMGGTALNLPAQGTAFLYQGRFNDSGSPANGNYDFVFSLYDASTNGNAISFPQTNLFVAVDSGLFTTNIDFGNVFTGTNYWLAIAVRASGVTNVSTNVFTALWPRQPLLPTPYAIFANSASNLLGKLPTTQLAGTLTSTQLAGTYSGAISFTNAGNAFSGTFSGNGSGLTNLNGSQISGGTVADARLSTNVALLNGNQTFGNANTFTSRQNNFTGSFFGNGLVGWINVNGPAVQATSDAGYLLLSPSLTTVTLPPVSSSLLTNDIVRISGAGSGGWLVAQNANENITGTFLSSSNSTWVQAGVSAGWTTIAASASGLRMVASASGGGGIYISSNYGQSWSQSTTTYSPFSVAISGDGTKLFGVSHPGGIIYSTNSGGNWYLSKAPSNTNWSCIAASANGTKLAATSLGGKIYNSTNSGLTWTNLNNSPSTNWNSVASSADGTKLAAVVFNGKIYTSTDSGITWTAQANAPKNTWISIASSADGTKLVAVADPGQIYTSPDSGVTWTAQSGAPTISWYNVACSADGGRIAAVIYTNSTGGIYISANSGVTWTPQAVPNQGWTGIALSGDGTKVAAVNLTTTTSGSIYYWQAISQSATTTTGTGGSITGPQGSAVELQYIGNGQWMPIGGTGTFWAN